jgi:hypothetical protein
MDDDDDDDNNNNNNNRKREEKNVKKMNIVMFSAIDVLIMFVYVIRVAEIL